MAFWSDLFTKAGKPHVQFDDPVSTSAVGHVVGNVSTGITGLGIADDLSRAVNTQERVIYVYRCVDAIASRAATIPIVVKKDGKGDGMEHEDPVVRLLTKRPNTYETATQFKYRLSSQLLLSTKGVFVEVIRSEAGKVVELHLLPSDKVEPIPDRRRYVQGFRVYDPEKGYVDLPPDRVVWIRSKPHPTNVFAQLTPLVAAHLAADTDYMARQFNRNFLRNDGRPGMIVAVAGAMNNEDRDALSAMFSGGYAQAGVTRVIEGDRISAVDLSGTPRDIQWQDALEGTKQDILLAFGVPESQLGNASGRTYDNADAEEEMFYKSTMVDHCNSIANAFDVLTTGGTEDDLIVAYDWSKIDVLQRQERARHQKAFEEFKEGAITIDEYRELTGKDVFDVPGTRVLWVKNTGAVGIGHNFLDTAEAALLVPAGQNAFALPPVEEENPAITQTESDRAVNDGVSTADRDTDDPNAAANATLQSSRPAVGGRSADRALRLVKELHRNPATGVFEETKGELPGGQHPKELETETKAARTVRSTVQREVRSAVSTLVRGYSRMVELRFKGNAIRKNTRYWSPAGTAALNINKMVNKSVAMAKFGQDILDLVEPIAIDAAERLSLRWGKNTNRAQWINDIKRIVVNQIVDQATVSFGRYVDSLRDQITAVDMDQSATRDDINKAISSYTSSKEKAWVPQFAEYVAFTVVEGAEAVAAQHLDNLMKVWNSMDDDSVRPSHWVIDGEAVGVHEKFKVGVFRLAFPRDPSAPSVETMGCRCFLTYRRPKTNESAGVPPKRRSA